MTNTPAGAPVTVIGLGPMGQALAGAFLKAGHPTTVWNRSADKAAELVEKGAVLAPTAAEAIAASPLVVVCVIDYGVVHRILDPETAALKGRTLVNLTADSPEKARETAKWAAEHGFDYLDGAIMTPTVTIGGPAASVLYSGPEEVYRTHQPTLAALGGTGSHLGADHGRAAAHDVALLDIFWTAMSGITHAFALAKAENIKATELTPFAQGIIGLLPTIIADYAEQIDAENYPGTISNVSSAAAGMEHIIHAADDRGIDTGILRAAKAIAQRAVDEGHGSDGFSRLTEVLGRPSA
ncbi:NAD(P)-dependent oxidoreductase [Streptomyces sp. UNOC14_S4]|uniref:NAD(P)-dependent oxidoreductase n=1 Tax=Streptomyces sp. UNOC14_S4 TaxID=2872340 RepID=UPI001E3F4C69|nr:NAD(P)-binding domain-containing protein [Streptomyces sp. UNOC14_S4]MCC3769959.1 NAD(P)-binding domain-containing protein [Streptomyces sp. UNOC14_S4]